MRMGFVKKIAVLVVGSMLVLAGGATADDWHGSGWTSTANPEVAAKTVQRLHDQLKATYEAAHGRPVKSDRGSASRLHRRSDVWQPLPSGLREVVHGIRPLRIRPCAPRNSNRS